MKRLYYDLRWKIEVRWLQLRQWWHMRHLKPGQCERVGCKEQGEPCYLDDTGVPSNYYCDKHMADEGFCRGCRLFWGGVESFEFSHAYGGYEGYCENCSDQIQHDLRGVGIYEPYGWEEDDGFDDDEYDPYADDVYIPMSRGGDA